MPAANRSTTGANILRSGKNKLTEIGNAPPTCGIRILLLRRRRLLRKNSYLLWRNFAYRITAGQVHLRKTDSNELGNANGDRTIGHGRYRSSVDHLLRDPTPGADQGAAAGGGECSNTSVERSDQSAARRRGVRCDFSSRRPFLQRPRCSLQTSI